MNNARWIVSYPSNFWTIFFFVARDINFGTGHMQVPRFWVTRGQSCTCPSSEALNFYWYLCLRLVKVWMMFMFAIKILVWLAINFAYSIFPFWFGANGQVKIKQWSWTKRYINRLDTGKMYLWFVTWDILILGTCKCRGFR